MCKRLVCLASLALLLSWSGDCSADLIAHLGFDEGSGNVAFDTSGNGHDGTLNGDPQWVAGRIGGALDFDGTDDYVEIPRVVQDDFTLAAWIKTDIPGINLGSQGYQGSGLIWSDIGGVANDFILAVLGTKLSFFCGNPDTSVNSDRDVTTGEWVHVAATRSAQDRKIAIFINGEHERTIDHANTGPLNAIETIAIGGNVLDSRYYTGLIDDVRLYDHVLSLGEILGAMEGQVWPFALGPSPEDGAIVEATWINITWAAGGLAVSHDVYLGDSFDDVNDATVDSPAFQGNQGGTSLIAGFVGFPYPDGLVPGTTYYWRIDEINDAEPNSPWRGDVWSFSIPPKTAHNPTVPDGARFVATDAELGWTPGFGAKLHTVYFGDDPDTVTNATGGAPQSTTSFIPGPLELDKTYYWRVDEFEAPLTHKGDVWSFTTTLPGLGKAIASRWENIQTTDIDTLKTNARYPNNPDVTEEVTEFAWDGPDLSDYGGRLEAWVYVPSTGDFTFWLNSDDQGELWLSSDDDPGNAKLIALESSWSALGTWGGGEEKSDPIPLVGGEKYYIMAIWKEAGGGDHCQVAWQGPGVPELAVIAGNYLSPFEPLSAYGAKPSNHSVDVTQVPILTWKAGLQAASHEVYFGTDEQAVADATKASPEYKGSRQLGDESLDPGKLDWNATYYWRVDEINNANPDSPWVGAVWSFTTADFLIVDDFESYDDVDPAPGEPGLNRIFDKWIDGFGTTTNGALVGNDMPPYAEQAIVHSGRQSMIYRYDNAGKTSEATLTLVYPRDWTEGGVTKLSLRINGSAANAADRIYIALNGTAVIYHDDASATQMAGWNEWVIDLAAFGVNLSNVNTISIGVGTKNAPSATGGTGTIYVDDIRLVK